MLGERLQDQISLGQAQALHRADMMLAQAPNQDHAQLYPPREKPRRSDEVEALQGPECIFLPRPSITRPTPSGLCKRRRHHDRSACGLNVILKPAILATQLPARPYLAWETEELQQKIMLEQQRSRTRKYAGSHPEAQDRTLAQAAEDQLRAQLKSPRQGRIPLSELQAASDAAREAASEHPVLFSVKEKIALRNLRREIAKCPQIRADVLAARPEMATHPLYCTNETLKKFGIDPFWDSPEESDTATPAPPIPARAPTRISGPLPLPAPESAREHAQPIISGFWEASSRWKGQEKSDSPSTTAETTTSGVLSDGSSRLDLVKVRRPAKRALFAEAPWTGRGANSPPKINKLMMSLDQELMGEEFESINGNLEQSGELANSVVSASSESRDNLKSPENAKASAEDIGSINAGSDFVNVDPQSTNGNLTQQVCTDESNSDLESIKEELESINGDLESSNGDLESSNGEVESTTGDSKSRDGDLKVSKGDLTSSNADKKIVDVDLESSSDDSERRITTDDLDDPLVDIF